jgi:hypothetical protein
MPSLLCRLPSGQVDLAQNLGRLGGVKKSGPGNASPQSARFGRRQV